MKYIVKDQGKYHLIECNGFSPNYDEVYECHFDIDDIRAVNVVETQNEFGETVKVLELNPEFEEIKQAENKARENVLSKNKKLADRIRLIDGGKRLTAIVALLIEEHCFTREQTISFNKNEIIKNVFDYWSKGMIQSSYDYISSIDITSLGLPNEFVVEILSEVEKIIS